MFFSLLPSQKRRFLISIGDDGAVLVYMVAGAVEGRFFFSSPDSPEMEKIFLSDTEASISVLVDVSDQSYLPHTLPPVSAMNVHSMARRRLEKEFERDDIKGALMISRNNTGRKDWNYIFVSIRNAPPFSEWMERLSAFPHKIAGIYLLPVEMEPLVKHIKKAIEAENVATQAQWQMLLTHHKAGGLRQVVFRNGRILFTRMAQPVGGNAPGVIAGHIEQEAINTLEYLRRLNYDEAQGLDLFIITSADVKKQLESTRLKASKVYVLTPHEVATQLNLPRATEAKDRFSDVVALAHFGKYQKPLLKLSTPQLDMARRFQFGMLALKALGYVLVPLAVLLILYNIYTSFAVSNRTETAEAALNKVRAEQRTLQQRADAQATRREETKAMVTLYDQFSADALVPFGLLARLHAANGDAALYKELRYSSNVVTDARSKKTLNSISFSANIHYPKRTTDEQIFIKEVEAFAARLRSAANGLKAEFSGLPGQTDYTLTVEGGPVPVGAAQKKTQTKNESSISLSITGPLEQEETKALFRIQNASPAPEAPPKPAGGKTP